MDWEALILIRRQSFCRELVFKLTGHTRLARFSANFGKSRPSITYLNVSDGWPVSPTTSHVLFIGLNIPLLFSKSQHRLSWNVAGAFSFPASCLCLYLGQ